MRAVWMLVAVAALVVGAEGFNCPIDNCNCTPSGDDHEIECHFDGTKVSIRLLQTKYYTLECESNSTRFDYSKVPRIAPGSTAFQSITFKYCPLPKTSFGRVISDLGIDRVTAVKLQSFEKTSGPIQRKHLEGLNDLQVTRLTLSQSVSTDLPSDLFTDVPNLKWLGLLLNNIQFPKDLFEPLRKLEILELNHNHLTEIPDEMLTHLSSLKKLYLWHNHIHTLAKSVFKGLAELSELDLSGNNLKELPAEIFEHLEKLTTISLHANNITTLPSNIFSYNKQLENMHLFNNNANLTKLPEYFLSDKENLLNVRLDAIGLVVIPGNVFTNSSSIVNISLARNKIENLSGSLFQDQVELFKLDLSDNRIKTLPENIFSHQTSLEYLYLDSNYIETISSDVFQTLYKLKELHMHHNRLKRIALDALNFVGSLTFIDMSHNHLDFLELQPNVEENLQYSEIYLVSPFHKVANLKHLDLSFNNITLIYSDWRINHLKLEYLNLTHNNITRIEYNEILFLSNEIVVDLTFNYIETVNFRLAESLALASDPQPDARLSRSKPAHNVKIRIQNNPLVCDCLMTWFLQYLKDKLDPQVRAQVDVEPGDTACASSPPGTGLEGKVFKQLRPEELLCLLDSESTEIKQCPKGCNCFVRLYDMASILDCTGGAVDRVPNVPHIKALNYTELHLENNSFTRIMRSEDIPEYVTKMYLMNNNLTQLYGGDIPKTIEVLDLRNNSLQHLNESVAEAVVNGSRLQKLWLAGNPLACDCQNIVFLGLVQKNRNKVQDYNMLVCPDGKSIKYLLVSALCGTAPVVVALSALLALMGLALGLAAAAYYKYNQHIKVYLFARGWCLWWVNEEEVDRDKLYDAFVSFSHKDEEFVTDKLIRPLEDGAAPYKLCVHFRDWVIGDMIPEQISKSVVDSRRTIVVLSPNFLASEWGKMEFREAHCHALKEGRARVIVVIYGDIGPTENLGPELQSYLATNTYVKWGDPWFWDKLRYALPHRDRRRVSAPNGVAKKKGFDDRLELIHPASPTTPPALNTPPAHQAQTNLLLQHVNGAPNGVGRFPALNGHVNGAITMNGLKVNGNAKHSEV